MSRRSLYRQSGRHHAAYTVDMDEKITHWSREWVTPQLSIQQQQQQQQQQQAQSQSTTPAPENGDKNTNGVAPKVLEFKVKAWVPIEDSSYNPIEDGEPDDILDMLSSEAKVVLPTTDNDQSGLSAADIRGAVSGEAIPGIATGGGEEAKPSAPTESEKTNAESTSVEVDAKEDGKVEEKKEPEREEPKLEEKQESEEVSAPPETTDTVEESQKLSESETNNNNNNTNDDNNEENNENSNNATTDDNNKNDSNKEDGDVSMEEAPSS